MNSRALTRLANVAFAGVLATGALAAPLAAQSAGVFIEQIGTNNTAEFDQSLNRQRADATQDGNDNVLDIDQQDNGVHSATVEQTGDANTAIVGQSGDGAASLDLEQSGASNVALVAQNDNGGAGTIGAVVQSGNGNSLMLSQDGTDNQASLTQIGDNNTMTATQTGDGNRLEWLQNGTGLPDLGITQTGGAIVIISQSN